MSIAIGFSLWHNWYVYIVLCSDNTYYTGISNNVDKRIIAHNNKKGAKYTKSRLPVKLVYTKYFGNRRDALREENRIKSLTRFQKEKLIFSNNI